VSFRGLQQKGGELFTFSLDFVGAETKNLDDLLATDNVLFEYIMSPSGNRYEANTIAFDEETGLCKSDENTPYALVSDDTSGGVGTPDYQLELNIIRNGLDKEIVVFCIENRLYDDLGQVGLHLTIVTGGFFPDGGFEIDEINIEVPSRQTAKFEFEKEYKVEAYQCTTDPFHIRTAEKNTQETLLGICVVTIGDDTFMDTVVDFIIRQGSSYSELYIANSSPTNQIASFDCTLSKPGSDVSGTMCFIEVALTNQFFSDFETELTGSGEVDLRLLKRRRGLTNMNHDPRQPRLLYEEKIRLNYEVTFSIASVGSSSKAVSLQSRLDWMRILFVATILVFMKI